MNWSSLNVVGGATAAAVGAAVGATDVAFVGAPVGATVGADVLVTFCAVTEHKTDRDTINFIIE